MMDACLTIKQLEQWAAGELSPEDVAALEPHVRQCPSCREQLEECRANAAFLARATPVLRRSSGSPAEMDKTCSFPGRAGDRPAGGTKASPASAIPGHEIVRELHRGGQGVVYEAVQLSTKRKVAIKILLEGAYASASARKRFEREIELVASLKHPHVIAIYHPGVTQEGHPFYVMEYVRGVPLHRYVRDGRLSLVKTLELFVAVCDAVNYAHQKGVIHRDLKPSNILVDASGTPKVLDFGLAKMVGGPEATLASKTGQVVGTLPYVSPEQARGNPDEIDTRTDVYALGVILYQVLTGEYPYPVMGQLIEVLKHIAETQPTPPSQAWRADAGVTLYGDRKKLSSRTSCPIDGEVETILLKALAKERQRRYQSVGELARDIGHYLAGEPIDAKRDSGLYVLRKLLRRYRVPVTVAAACSVVIFAVLAVAAVQQSRLARKQAELNVRAASEIMATFVSDPADAITRARTADAPVGTNLAAICDHYVSSPGYTDRIMGARAGLVVNPEAFWASVDGGELWKNGEWLEVCRADWPDPEPILAQLREKAIGGTPRQQYVAFCLIGQMSRGDEELAEVCESGVESAPNAGVAMAARWAARRLGRTVAVPSEPLVVKDEISRLTFVRVGGCDAFRPGSDADDPARYPDEVVRDKPVAVPELHLSSTEVTLAAFAPFVRDEANADLFGPFTAANEPANDARRLGAENIRARLDSLSQEELEQTPVSWVDLEGARRYCEWLNAQAAKERMARRYRLPAEQEWEHAARGSGGGRFCFGDDDDYVAYFAVCRGDERVYRVGRRMPNWFGLFDVHGGLWEWCDTRYPAKLVTDPSVSPQQAQNLHVVKGGALYSPGVRCRPAQRNYGELRTPAMYWSFRVVMEEGRP